MRNYDIVARRLDGTMDDACHSYAKAKDWGFSAFEFMPMPLPLTAQLDDEDYD